MKPLAVGDGAAFRCIYNGDGRQNSVTSPDGNLPGANAGNYTTVTTYGVDQQTTAVTQAGGTGATVTPRTTGYGYDADLNQTTITDPRGFTTTTTFNADDEPTFVADPNGDANLTCYDGDGNSAQTVPAVGVAANNLTPASCPTAYPAGYSTRLASDATVSAFNGLGQMTQQTSPAPAGQSGYETVTNAYDGDGNLLQVTAPPAASGGPNQVTVNTYNSVGEMASQTTGYGTAAAATISYCYDPSGDTTSVVYPDGNTSAIASCEAAYPWVVSASSYPTQASYQSTSAYDSAGELVSRTAPATAAAPSGATTSETYDPAGNTLTRDDPNGVTSTWTYTPLDNPATLTYSGSSAHSVSYGYDANGEKLSMTDGTGATSYVWDPFGELTSETNGAPSATGYAYNSDGQIASITYPLPAAASWAATKTVTYSYDHADILNGVTDFNSHQITITNTADGEPNSAILGSTGDTASTTYDATDSPSAITLKSGAGTLESFAYSDSPAGNVMTETDTPSSSQTPALYTYDANSRVTSMTPGSGSTLNYSFDASSNLTTLPPGGSTSYDKAGELTSSTLSGAATSYSYDADGQRISVKQGTTTTAAATWNGAAELTSYADPTANMISATYDGTGLRMSATTSAGTQNFVWNTASGRTQLLMDTTNAYIYTTGLAPAEQVNLATGTVTYLVTDSLGSVRGAVNASGTLSGKSNYDAWGDPESPGGLTATTPFGFAGGYTDPDGLVYLIHRYYDPTTGQFFSVDPDLGQTYQPYAYAGGDPVNQSDPSGLYSYKYFWTLGGRGPVQSVFSYFAHHARKIFPFSTGGCLTLYLVSTAIFIRLQARTIICMLSA